MEMSCFHVNQLVTSCASDLSRYARPVDQLAAARLDQKDISMLQNSSNTEALSLPLRSRARRAMDVDAHPALLDRGTHL